MPTDEERKEVARSLRDTSEAIADWGDADPFWYVMKCAYGDVLKRSPNELFCRLADLIEPGLERTCKAEIYTATVPKFDHDEEVDMYECSLCGFYLSRVEDGFLPNYCPHCGAKVVGDGEM